MNKEELTEYADYLLQIAMYKVHNVEDAEDLVQETLVAGLVAIHEEKSIDNMKSWLTTVLNHKYCDLLRRKYHKPTVSMDVVSEIPDMNNVLEKIEQSEDAEAIRRCLAHLTQLYRQVMVRYYMRGESIKQIATELNLSENTVKSRLDIGRKHIRKDFSMENYTKQSYEPEKLWLCSSGQDGMDREPLSLVRNNTIEMNLLILAYKKPITIPELARAIGISTAYMEPIIDKLVDGELMKRVSDKVYTDFIIYTEDDRKGNFELEKELAEANYREVWDIVQRGLNELHEKEYYREMSPNQQVKLDAYFAVRTIQNAVNNIRNEVSGGMTRFEDYPNRKNGGKWFCMGNRFPGDYDYEKEGYHDYSISGERGFNLVDYCGLKRISLLEYDCLLGDTYQGYGVNRGFVDYPMDGMEVMKMLYAIYRDNEEELPIINMHCFDNINGFIKLNYLARKDNKIVVEVPVISMEERWELYGLSEKYDRMISETFRHDIMKLMRNPVVLPPHLKSVPQWQRYMWCCSSLPMLLIEKAYEHGLFLAGRSLREDPVPATVLAVEM